MNTRPIRAGIVLATGSLLVAGSIAAVPAASAAPSSQTLHFLEKGTSATLETAAGKPITGNPSGPPMPGQKLELTGNLYKGSHAKHSKNPVGTDHTLCTFTKTLDTVCDAEAALGGSMIVITSKGGDGDFDSPVTGGTGRYLGVVGNVHNHPVSDQLADLTVTIHKASS
jgi:hypothetical protein